MDNLLIKAYDEVVSIRYLEPKKSKCLYIIAHGAGAGIEHPFMETCQKLLYDVNIATYAFNFIYKEKGKKFPGGKKALDETYKAVWKHVVENFDYPVFIGGKSMGGRISSRVIDDLKDVKGLIFLGYPIHPPGRPEKFSSPQLFEIDHPMLFLQGSRDAFSSQPFASKTVESTKNGKLIWLNGGDHSWKTRKKDDKTQEQLMAQATSAIVNFCNTHS